LRAFVDCAFSNALLIDVFFDEVVIKAAVCFSKKRKLQKLGLSLLRLSLPIFRIRLFLVLS
jgi:small basic protein